MSGQPQVQRVFVIAIGGTDIASVSHMVPTLRLPCSAFPDSARTNVTSHQFRQTARGGRVV